MLFSTHSHTSHLLHCCFYSVLRLGNCLLCHGSGEVFVVTLFLNSLTMCAAVSEEAASDILVGRSHASGAGLVRDPRAANWSTQPQPGYELSVTSARVHVRVNRVVVVCCCTFFAGSIACTQNRVKWSMRRQSMLSQFWRMSTWAPPRSGACGSVCLNTGKLTRFSHTVRIDRFTALS